MGRADVGDPVADRLAGRVLQGTAAGVDGQYLGPEHPHPNHVEALALHVHAPHVDVTLEAQERRRRGGRDPVLAGARLGDDPPLAHATRQKHLGERVVDLVRPGVVEVFPLQVQPLDRKSVV